MKQLHKHVIPKIAAYWKTVAEFLELETTTIDHVEERFRDDPTRCCEEAFREWLKSDDAVEPKTWLCLMTILKEIKSLNLCIREISHELNIEG